MIAITGIFYRKLRLVPRAVLRGHVPAGRMQSVLLDDGIAHRLRRAPSRGRRVRPVTASTANAASWCAPPASTFATVSTRLRGVHHYIGRRKRDHDQLDRLVPASATTPRNGHKTRWFAHLATPLAVAGGGANCLCPRRVLRANVLRLPGAPRIGKAPLPTASGSWAVNKKYAEHYTLSVDVDPGYQTVMPMKTIELQAQSAQHASSVRRSPTRSTVRRRSRCTSWPRAPRPTATPPCASWGPSRPLRPAPARRRLRRHESVDRLPRAGSLDGAPR